MMRVVVDGGWWMKFESRVIQISHSGQHRSMIGREMGAARPEGFWKVGLGEDGRHLRKFEMAREFRG